MAATVGPTPKSPPGGGVINQPVAYPGDAPAKPVEPSGFKPEELKKFAGELGHGELGFIELNEEGTPTGVAKAGEIPKDKFVARVVGMHPNIYDEVVTPSGAPLTKHMNPSPDLWDAGMLDRNPTTKEGWEKRNKELKEKEEKASNKNT